MRHARKDYDHIQDVVGGIPAEEPVFLIRGQDIVAGNAVRAWASLAVAAGADPAIVQRALRHADVLDAWPKKKVPDLPEDGG